MATTLFTIPEELVVQIFKTLIPDSGDDTSEPVVLLLSRVCKFCRELVINSPTLWTYIRLRSFRDLKVVLLFIERSKTCLLDVSVCLDVIESINPEIIQSYAVPRWRRLTVRGPVSSEVTRFVQAISEIPTPELQEVRLLPRSRSDCQNDEHVPLLSGASAALRSLALHGCVRCLAPLPNLTTLNISRLLCNYEEFRNLIQASPNLTTLILGDMVDRINFETFPDPDRSPRATIEVLSLKIFAVGFTNTHLTAADDTPILASLSMPNLEYLEISGSRADYGELSGKEFPALRTLCLRNMVFPPCDPALYRSFSKITHLELNHVQGAELLVGPEEGGALPWPDLQTLVCRVPDGESCSWLKNILEHRQRLTLRVPENCRDSVVALGRDHDVRFLLDEPWGLIRAEDFAHSEWEDDEDDDFSGSEFEHYSDEIDLFEELYEDNYEYELEHGMEDGDDGYDDEDGAEWF
ncbi:hypothetical protein B0H11DRAFT_2013779 [Mycena galericulata]|nr:hypothetical protein B0H11DRAFT_2013779 [Mycena galericulata]